MIHELRTLVAFDQAGSVQAAAARVGRTQSAVTRQLQRLEVQLGLTLLDRRARPPRLTPEGVTVLAQSRRVLVEADRLLDHACAAMPVGELRLGISHGAHSRNIAACLAALRTTFPGVTLKVTSGWSGELQAGVDEGRLHAAVLLRIEQDPAPAGDADRLVVFGGGDMAATSLADLAGRVWVLGPRDCEVRMHLAGRLAAGGIGLEVAVEAQDPALQRALVAQGMGLGYLPWRMLGGADFAATAVGGLDAVVRADVVRMPDLGRFGRVIDHVRDGVTDPQEGS